MLRQNLLRCMHSIPGEKAIALLSALTLMPRRYNSPQTGYVGPVTSCAETFGLVPETANGIHYEWNNTGRTYRCKPAP